VQKHVKAVQIEGGIIMAYETKVILRLLANQVALAETLEQAFEMIRTAAQVEGLIIPDLEEVRKELGINSESKK